MAEITIQKNLFSPFIHQKVGDSVCVRRDLSVLLNSKLLENFDSNVLKDYIKTLGSFNEQEQDIISKVPDSQLSAFIKSRHIQQPSDVLRYSEELSKLCDDYKESFKDVSKSFHDRQVREAEEREERETIKKVHQKLLGSKME